MKKIIKIFTLLFFIVITSALTVTALDLEALTDEFYMGLAKVIERNMDDPDGCVMAVNDYYRDNEALIARIREETARRLEQAAPMMQKQIDEYMNMTEEELAVLEAEAEMQGMQEPQMSAAMIRYSEAIEAFTSKYPNEGIEIGFKAFELMPDMNPEY